MNDVYSISEEYIPELDTQVDFQGSFTEKQKFIGGVDVISLSVGSKFFKRFNIGMSANFWMNGYEGELKKNFSGKIFSEDIPSLLETVEFMATEHLDVDIKGLNFNIGLLVDVLENLKIGAVYKSSFKANDKYSIFVSRENILGESNTEPSEVRRSGSSPLKSPATWGVGISYRPIDPLTISADFTTTQWSTAIIKNFPIHDDRGEIVRVTDVYFPTMKPVRSEGGERFRQLDTRQFRLGVEYVLIGKRTLIPIRLGFFTDSQYYSNSSGTRITYIGITGGVGIKRGGFGVDLALLYESGSYLRDNIDYSVTRFAEVRVYLSTNYSF
jgi:long-subunit fatty acid transport protein